MLLARRFGLNIQIAVAESAAHALTLARVCPGKAPPGSGELPHTVSIHALFDFSDPFQALEPECRREIEAIITALETLGIRTIGEFMSLPSRGLASRFGKKGLELMSRLKGRSEPPWPRFYPAELISEEADTECFDLESLSFVLKGLIDRAMARLRGRAERAALVRVGVEFEKWSTIENHVREWKIALPIPQGAAVGLLPIVQEYLGFDMGRAALPAPVQKLIFEVLETAPGRGAQRDFFSKQEEESEVLDSLVGRLVQKLGDKQVFKARPVERYAPEGAYVREHDFELEVGESLFVGRRPTRLLSNPEPIENRGSVLAHSRFRKEWHPLRWEGPERLCGEWWSHSFSRDYYRIATAEGEMLWVYSDLQPGADRPSIFLHGYFD